MADSGRLQTDPLFQGLARPAMLMGVSYLFFIFNGALNYLMFVWTNNFLTILGTFPVIHGIAYLICLKEPRMLELAVLRMSKGMKCLNRAFHGRTNSYDVF